jgi:hypothetical protein
MLPADHPPAIYWDRPGADRWRGTDARAFDLLAAAAGIDAAVLESLQRSACRLRDVREGEVFDAMVFGRGRVMTGVVARPSHWPLSASRLVMECGDGFDHFLLYPIVCGNWSIESGGWGIPPYAVAPAWGWGGGENLAGEAGEEGGGGYYGGYGGYGALLSGGAPYGGASMASAFVGPNAEAAGSIIVPESTTLEFTTTSWSVAPPTAGTPAQNIPVAMAEPPSALILAAACTLLLALPRHAFSRRGSRARRLRPRW